MQNASMKNEKGLNDMTEKPYDIQQRTFLFGLNIIRISGYLPLSQVGKILCNQLVRSGNLLVPTWKK
jgi:hypothetical protein